MQQRAKTYTPEDRVLRWIATWSGRFPRGIPTDRFVRHLKGDLTGISYAQLDTSLRTLEGQGAVRREWDTPGEYRVFLTPAGSQRATRLEGRATRPPVPTEPAAPAIAPAPSGAVPKATPVAGAFNAPPSPSPAAPTAASPMPEPTVQGRAPGPIPSSGTPASANLPVRILLYCMLYHAGKGEGDGVVPGEDLTRYLMSQGFLLSDDYLTRLFEGLQRRGLLVYRPRPTGGYDLRLSSRGHHLAEGLLSGHVATRRSERRVVPAQTAGAGSLSEAVASEPSMEAEMAAPVPAPDGGAAEGVGDAPSGEEEDLQDRWSAAEAENAELRHQVETLRRTLSETEERGKADRETVEELMHQMEVQAERIQALERELAERGTELTPEAPAAGAPAPEAAPSENAPSVPEAEPRPSEPLPPAAVETPEPAPEPAPTPGEAPPSSDG